MFKKRNGLYLIFVNEDHSWKLRARTDDRMLCMAMRSSSFCYPTLSIAQVVLEI